MFSAVCQGCHSLRELKKKLICAEKELLDPPGMAAKNRQRRGRCKAFLLPISLGEFIFQGVRGEGSKLTCLWGPLGR